MTTIFFFFFQNKRHLPGTAIGTTVTGPTSGMTCHTSCVFSFVTFLVASILICLSSGMECLCIFIAACTIHLAK